MVLMLERCICVSIMTLNPGDIISTGTPPGKGTLNPKDTIEAEIEGVGRLSNTVA